MKVVCVFFLVAFSFSSFSALAHKTCKSYEYKLVKRPSKSQGNNHVDNVDIAFINEFAKSGWQLDFIQRWTSGEIRQFVFKKCIKYL